MVFLVTQNPAHIGFDIKASQSNAEQISRNTMSHPSVHHQPQDMVFPVTPNPAYIGFDIKVSHPNKVQTIRNTMSQKNPPFRGDEKIRRVFSPGGVHARCEPKIIVCTGASHKTWYFP